MLRSYGCLQSTIVSTVLVGVMCMTLRSTVMCRCGSSKVDFRRPNEDFNLQDFLQRRKLKNVFSSLFED